MNFSLVPCPSVLCHPSLHLSIHSLACSQTAETLWSARHCVRSGEYDDKKDWFQCHMGFPSGSDCNESACNAGDPGLIPGSGRSPWSRTWQPISAFLPKEAHGQRSPASYSPWSHKESDTVEWLTLPVPHWTWDSQMCLAPPCLRTFTLTVTSVWKILVLFLSTPTFASTPPPSFRPQLEGHLHGEGFLGHSTSLRPQCVTLITTCHFLS